MWKNASNEQNVRAYYVKPSNKGFIIPLQNIPAILLFSVFAQSVLNRSNQTTTSHILRVLLTLYGEIM